MKSISIKEKAKNLFDTLKGEFGYKNKLQTIKINKIIVTTTIGSIKDVKKKELMLDRMTKITGQKPVTTVAKKSVAGFKIRQGDKSGYKITLRGERMWSFLDKVVNIAFPRTKDFRGVSDNGIDGMGNFSFGIKEHTVFPETSNENVQDVFSLGATIVTNSNDKKEVKAMLNNLGFMFKNK